MFNYTVQDFKEYFKVRYFAYLTDIEYDELKTYKIGDEVYIKDGGFYTSIANENIGFPPAENPEKWTVTIDNIENYILDTDIESAIGEARMSFREGLWEEEHELMTAFSYLVAHYLCLDVQTSLQGIASNGNFPIANKSVGSISVGFVIPEMYLKDPFVAYLNKTGFGQKYFSFLLPRIRCQGFGLVRGRSLP